MTLVSRAAKASSQLGKGDARLVILVRGPDGREWLVCDFMIVLDSGLLEDAEAVRGAVEAEIEYLREAAVPAGPEGERWVAVAVQHGIWAHGVDGYRCVMSRCDDGDSAAWLKGIDFADGKPETSYQTPQEALYRGRVAVKLGVLRAVYGDDGAFPMMDWWPHRLTEAMWPVFADL